MDGFKKCTSRPAPSVCRFLQQNRPKADIGCDGRSLLDIQAFNSRAGVCVLSGEQLVRRLTAILPADVAGYSRLMGTEEEARLLIPRLLEKRSLTLKSLGVAGSSS